MWYLYNKILMTFNIEEYNKILDFIKKNTQYPCKVVAISKNHSVSSVLEALDHGIRCFGENRVQEAQGKFEKIRKKINNIELHLTGPLQTNKVKIALKTFDIFQTLDREKLALEFSKNTDLINNKKFFIQVNTGAEKTKSGVLVNEANEFIKFCQNELVLNVVGLMCIPPIKDYPDEHFLILRQIAKNNNLSQLSMGMSADYKKGVLSGATYIRIGTRLFGDRREI